MEMAHVSGRILWARPLFVHFRIAPARLASYVSPGSRESFLLDREWVYGRLPGGLRWAVRVEHAPWNIRSVEARLERRASHPLLDAANGPIAAELAEDQEVALVEVAVLRREQP